jgi:vacuolar iron transporter family protein
MMATRPSADLPAAPPPSGAALPDPSPPESPVGTGRAAALVRDVILGGQDGLVNVLGLVLGMAVATGDTRLVVTAGLAAALSESIAMAGVAYTSSGAERGMAARVGRRIQAGAAERHAARRRGAVGSLAAGGASSETIDAVAEAVDREGRALDAELEAARATMAPMRETRPLRAALVVGSSTLLGSTVPLVPFAVLPIAVAPIVALLGAVIVLFGAGVERGHVSGGGRLRAGLELVGIGVVSALAGYVIGQVLRTPGT